MSGRVKARATARVAIVQHRSSARLDQALEQTVDLAHQAAVGGAELVVFPETWIPGYPAWIDSAPGAAFWNHEPVKAAWADIAANSIDVDGPSGRRLQALARELDVSLVIGISEQVGHGPGRNSLYNALLTIGPDGSLLNHHRKLVPTFSEKLIWAYGDVDGLRAVDTPVGRVGSLVCWEHWMPLPRQAMHDAGEDLHVAVWPTVHADHQLASRHYAFEGRCHVLAAGALLHRDDVPAGLAPEESRIPGDDWLLRGGSCIIGPDGRFLVEPVFDRETIIHAELDLGRNRREAMNLDVSGHYHRRELMSLTLKPNGRAVSRPAPRTE